MTTSPAGRTKVASAAVWAGFGTGTTVVAGLLRVAVLAVVHEGAELADALFLTAVIPTVATILRLGVERSAPRFIGFQLGVGATDRAAGGFRSALLLSVGLGLVGAILVLLPIGSDGLLGPFVSTEMAGTMRLWLGLWLAAEILRRTVAESSRVYTRFGTAFLADSGPRGLVFVVAVALSGALGDASLTVTIALGAIATTLAAVLPALSLYRGEVAGVRSGKWPTLELLKLSPLMLVILVGTMLQATGDLWVVSRHFADVDRTHYLVAFQIATTFGLVMQVENMTAQPFIARWVRRPDGTGAVSAIAQLVATAGAGVVALGAIAVAIATLVLPDTLGDITVRSVVGPAALLIAGQLVNCCAGPCGTLFIMSDRVRTAAVAAAVFGVLGVSFEWIAGSAGSLLGVAAISGGVVAAQNAVLAWLAPRQLGVTTNATLNPVELKRHIETLRNADV